MNIQTSRTLADISTFGLEASSKYFVDLGDESDLQSLSDFVTQLRLPSLSIGGGSNLIFCADYPGLIIRSHLGGIERISDTKVRVASGEIWDDFVAWTVENNLSGVEALSGIPGSVGGAVALNAGAYGQAMRDTLERVRVYDVLTKKIIEYDTSQLHYWHRTSIFREKRGNDWLILDAVFKLRQKVSMSPHPKLIEAYGQQQLDSQTLRQTVLKLRNSLPDPNLIQNSGSFFLNPTIDHKTSRRLSSAYPDIKIRPYGPKHQQIAAGWLLEQAELKGKTIGGFHLSESHANIVTNIGTNSTGQDLSKFIGEIQQIVDSKFGIRIVPEPLLVGEEFWQGMLSRPATLGSPSI